MHRRPEGLTVKRALDRITNAVTAIAAILAALIALALVAAQITGGHIVTVLSGSMEPTYHTGSLLFVRPVDVSELAAGDVIAYVVSDNVMVTHRIVEVVPDESDASQLRFRTKGDANTAADEALVSDSNVVGTPLFSLPLAGYAVNYVQHPPGLFVAVGAVLVILLAAIVPPLLDRKEEKKD